MRSDMGDNGTGGGSPSRRHGRARGRHGMIWAAFGGIAALGLFGGAAMSAGVPYHYSSVTLPEVFRHMAARPTRLVGGVSFAFLSTVLPGAVMMAAFTRARSARSRRWLASAAIIAPLLLMSWNVKGVAIWVLSYVLAPMLTAQVIAGQIDGETYSEGLIIIAALGWWQWLWTVLAISEWRRRPHAEPAG